MALPMNWSGKKFFYLTIIDKNLTDEGRKRWNAQCDCGNIILINPNELKKGIKKHCGCKFNPPSGQDWSGITFNALTFVKKSAIITARGEEKWELLCACGEICISTSYLVAHEKVKACDKCENRKSRSKDWAGIKRHCLTFIRRSEKTHKYGGVLWEAQCECGTIIHINPSQNVKSCGCFITEKMKASWVKISQINRKYDPIISSARVVYNGTYKDGDISFEDFMLISQLPCNYCGAKPHNKRTVKNATNRDATFIYNGLDRVDSNQGHLMSNVVPCCVDCNFIKRNKSVETFMNHIKRIYEYSILSKK